MDGAIPNYDGIFTADTITKVPPEAEGHVVISGSHGGRYPGYQAAKAHVRAVIFNDAGIGKDGAGMGSLSYLEALGIAAAVVSHGSCRIGDTSDMLARGLISHANAVAAEAGVEPGQTTLEAASRLRDVVYRCVDPPVLGEARSMIPGRSRNIILLDSASLVRPDDAGQIVVTGSHGALVGGIPRMALRVDGFAAAFNDAGIGRDCAGITRLPALDERGIAAITVAAMSARIGEAASTFADGVISAANETAKRLGASEGMRARDVLSAWAKLALHS